MPFYDHICEACQYEWEDFYSMVTNPPDVCPKCYAQGQVKRLISCNIAVRCPKTGHELKRQISEEKQKIRSQIKTDEKFRANVKGEFAYHKEKIYEKKINDDLKQFK